MPIAQTTPEAWLGANLPGGATLGYDPWLHTVEGAEKLAKACARRRNARAATNRNPIDAIWRDRPAPPLGAVVLHDLNFAGEPAEHKLDRIRAELARSSRPTRLIVTDPHAVAWTFNIRGADIAHTPIVLAFAIVPRDGRPALYVDGRKLSNSVRHAARSARRRARAGRFRRRSHGARRGAAKSPSRSGDRRRRASACVIGEAGGKATRDADPIALMKAVKNPTEIAGARAAHLRDGAAVTRFLAWFDARSAERQAQRDRRGRGAGGISAATPALLKDISFPTISGAGPNGAIVHYRVTRKTNRRIAPGDLFLIDSGAQYEDGTTDITRTVARRRTDRGNARPLHPRAQGPHRDRPRGVSRWDNRRAARQFRARALWGAGLDFDHGTGHGVGSYLSVHEGPARISKLGTAALKRGMILSNEPGYYKAGAYGIRIENLVLVVEAPPVAGAEKPLNAFRNADAGADRPAADRCRRC